VFTELLPSNVGGGGTARSSHKPPFIFFKRRKVGLKKSVSLRLLCLGNAIHILDTQCILIDDGVMSVITPVLVVALAKMSGHKLIGIGYIE
jgi:hypothetical protein